jgi:hypothetical protein
MVGDSELKLTEERLSRASVLQELTVAAHRPVRPAPVDGRLPRPHRGAAGLRGGPVLGRERARRRSAPVRGGRALARLAPAARARLRPRRGPLDAGPALPRAVARGAGPLELPGDPARGRAERQRAAALLRGRPAPAGAVPRRRRAPGGESPQRALHAALRAHPGQRRRLYEQRRCWRATRGQLAGILCVAVEGQSAATAACASSSACRGPRRRQPSNSSPAAVQVAEPPTCGPGGSSTWAPRTPRTPASSASCDGRSSTTRAPRCASRRGALLRARLVLRDSTSGGAPCASGRSRSSRRSGRARRRESQRRAAFFGRGSGAAPVTGRRRSSG